MDRGLGAEQQLAFGQEFYDAPASPAAGLVSVDGRWEITWDESSVTCEGFNDALVCRDHLQLSSIESSSARTSAVTVTGGPVPGDNTSYAMTGTETTSFFCEGVANISTHDLTFAVTKADLVGGIVVARQIVGQLELTATSGNCDDASIVGAFSAVRTG